MRELIKATTKVCSQCKYVIGFGSQPGKLQTNGNICCNYLDAKGCSRLFENGEMAYDPQYCDKFERGNRVTGAWNSDNMTMWKKHHEKKEEFWQHEEEANYPNAYSGYFDVRIRED